MAHTQRSNRPPVPPEKQRSAQIFVYLRPAERSTIEAHAEDLGLSVSTTARQALLAGLKQLTTGRR